MSKPMSSKRIRAARARRATYRYNTDSGKENARGGVLPSFNQRGRPANGYEAQVNYYTQYISSKLNGTS